MYKFLIALVLFIFSFEILNAQSVVKINTEYGNIVVKLYDQTPNHKKNFLKLVKSKYYDDAIFHRVIKNFMIQAGEIDSSKKVAANTSTLDAEIIDTLYHKKGALAAARLPNQVNPKKRSSATQFYIVQGQVFNDKQLDAIEQKKINENIGAIFAKNLEEIQLKYKTLNMKLPADSIHKEALLKSQKEASESTNYKFTAKQREIYKTIGGTPHLDGEYTIFGEVIEGLDVIDKIADVQTGKANRPVKKIKMTVTIVK